MGFVGGENRRKIGAIHEQEAAHFLEERGYVLLESNFRCRQGEIDLIARDGDFLVFVEVRYRADRRRGHPLETVDRRKQNTICRVSDVYRYQRGIPEGQAVRFDVIGVLGKEITLVQNAFPYTGRAGF